MKNKERLLISSCLVGQNVRYDSSNNLINDLSRLEEDFVLEYICPEVGAGMSIPRKANEISNFDPLIVEDINGIDNTKYFKLGANIALDACSKLNIKYALLKAKSPSCGNEKVYDGNFDGILIDGVGVTSSLLIKNGIKVFNENQIEDLYELAIK